MTKGNKNVAPSRGEDSALTGFNAGQLLNKIHIILKQSILFSLLQSILYETYP
jgi:hypothetical protein